MLMFYWRLLIVNKSIIGQTFERWKVLGWSHKTKNGHHYYQCICSCGTTKQVSGSNLKTGATKSCGCLNKEIITKHGLSSSPEYTVWEGIIQRCYNSNSTVYEYYGGRGIKFHEPWRKSFKTFYDYIGKRPSKLHSLERIDNNGNYEPDNVKWATLQEQHINRRPKPTSYQVLQLNKKISELETKLGRYIKIFGDIDAF